MQRTVRKLKTLGPAGLAGLGVAVSLLIAAIVTYVVTFRRTDHLSSWLAAGAALSALLVLATRKRS